LVAVLTAVIDPQESPFALGDFGLVATSETSTPIRTFIEATSPQTKKGCKAVVKQGPGHKCLVPGSLTLKLPLDITSGVPIFIEGDASVDASGDSGKKGKRAEAVISDPMFLELPAAATYVSTSGVFLNHSETAAPEPTTLLLFVTGLTALGGVLVRKWTKLQHRFLQGASARQ
jgi:hypothetical protein